MTDTKNISRICVVSQHESYMGQGVFHPVRYYYSPKEAEKDVADGGTDEEWKPYRRMKIVEILEHYQPHRLMESGG